MESWVWNIHFLGLFFNEDLEDVVKKYSDIIEEKKEKYHYYKNYKIRFSVEREDWVFLNFPAVTLKLKRPENNNSDISIGIFNDMYADFVLHSLNWGQNINCYKIIFESTNLTDKNVYTLNYAGSETYFRLGRTPNSSPKFLFKSLDRDFKKAFEENTLKLLEIHLI